MSDDPNRIVITGDELRDPKIDEVLQSQRLSIAGAIQPAQDKKGGFRLIYATWFYLMLAGALGAFAAWALLEPYFDDGLVFTGRIEEADPQAVLVPGFSEIRGRLLVSGAEVWLLPAHTRVGSKGSNRLSSTSELQPGQVVTVQVEVAPRKQWLLAAAVRLEPPGTPAPARIAISELMVQNMVATIALFPLVAGLIGLMVGSVEGIVCRTFKRAAWCGGIGLLAGLIGGLVSWFFAELIYGVLGLIGSDPNASGGAFVLQMFRRGLAWTIAGTTMGLGQGFALRSGKLRLNGFVGGMVGALIGGLLFDPIALVFSGRAVIAQAELSRGLAITLIGAIVGVMIGLTEMLTRDAWLKVTLGPLRGKEFSFNRTPIRLGSSPKGEIYLFKDVKIDPLHATINKLRDTYEISDEGSSSGTFVNGQRIRRHRLADGDVIRIGESEFTYSSRERSTGKKG